LIYRVGCVQRAEQNEKARKPAYKPWIDLGPLGVKQSSAQITDLYTPESVTGRLVIAAVNLGARNVAGFASEVLVPGLPANGAGLSCLRPSGTCRPAIGSSDTTVRPPMHSPQNLFADLPDSLPDELFQTLLSTSVLRIERIVSHGHASPEGFWYDQDQNEWVLLVSGAARLRFEGEAEPLEMGPGSFVNIPAHRRHRVEWTDPGRPTVWLAIHHTDDAT
jgi:cupin 2 domain-containing protein